MRSLATIGDLIGEISLKAEKKSEPVVRSTPKPEKSKVVFKFPRIPINKQADLIIAQYRSWISQPIPSVPTSVPSDVVRELQNRIATLSNENGRLSAEIGLLRERLRNAVKHTESVANQNRLLLIQLASIRIEQEKNLSKLKAAEAILKMT